LTPTVALVTNVEWEHVDVYENAEAVAEAFAAFASRTRPGGALVLCADDPGARALLDAAPSGVRLVTYGTHPPPKLDACCGRRLG
jgi:UDP-N-acetylmuramate--alanine ligase